MISKLLSINKVVYPILLCLALTACGSKHHSKQYVGAANVRMTATPRSIDTGDRAAFKIEISDVHDDGILLKIHYPYNLEYVKNSAYIKVDDVDISLTPDVDTDVSSSLNAGHFLVFFLDQYNFEDRKYGDLYFELQGIASVKKAEVGVDADVNDLNIDDSEEFDPLYPEYSAESYVEITVKK